MRTLPTRVHVTFLGVIVLMVSAAETRAEMVDANFFSKAYPNDPFQAFAFDPTTGTYYNRANYNSGGLLSSYGSATALAANTPSRTVALQGGGFTGTYFAVRDGHVYGRADSTSNAVAEWDATTGLLLATGTIPDFGGANRTDTFDWGGYTGSNWLQDTTGLYTLGHVPGGSLWSIHKMGADLNILSTRTFTADTLGYAFLIGGTLFTAPTFGTNVVDRAIDLATGTITPVSFAIRDLGIPYISNALYDPSRDRLYLQNPSTSTLYSIDSASQAFRVGAQAVPEPASLALLGLGAVAMLGYLRRRGPDHAELFRD